MQTDFFQSQAFQLNIESLHLYAGKIQLFNLLKRNQRSQIGHFRMGETDFLQHIRPG